MKLRKFMTPGRILVFSFAALIAAGTALLSLPCATVSRQPLPFIDTLFTATSAACVTGLIVAETGEVWSPFGQTVIALLIQLGGLGIASAGIFLMMLAGKGNSIRSQLLVKESMNLNSLKDAQTLLRITVYITLAVELTGAALSALVFCRYMPVGQAIGTGLFHAVATFNNAGFDIFGGGQSMTNSLSSPLLLTVTAVMTVLGGLGFATLVTIWRSLRKKSALTLQAKIVLTVSAGAIAFVTAFLMISERLPLHGALSQTISTRSAGFAFYDLGSFSNAGLLVITLSMFLGASSGSTGGGIKTTTAFVLGRAALCFALGKPVTAFGRRIGQDAVRKAVSLTLLACAIVAAALILLCLAEPDIPLIDLLVETVSAFGTVGLTTGITSQLSPISRAILILVMFCGRLGPVTMACLWFSPPSNRVSFPEERILIG